MSAHELHTRDGRFGVSDEAVERALKAYWEDENNRFWPRMRAALEASGAVFLTAAERQALLMASRVAMENCGAGGPLLQSAREKLT